jgi:pyruvate kinase
MLDDGRIELRVTANTSSELTTVVVHGGELGEHKGINAPGVALPASAMTDKDAADLAFGLDLGVDIVALSFVQTADDIERARARMASCGRTVPIVAKIERPAAVQNLASILEIAQGVMVARGDLGLEMPLEQVPRVQKEIIRQAREHGRPVIVATQVLESMRVQPRPTRAEVSDAANAVDDGVDAIMLAGETAVGAYPVRAVETLDAIIRDAETLPPAKIVPLTRESARNLHARALCEAAVTLATTGQADAIVAVTRGGTTARLLSALRPAAPIYAATNQLETANTLALLWGVQSIVTAERDPDRLESLILERGVIRQGAVVVFVSISAELGSRESNFLNVQRIGL